MIRNKVLAVLASGAAAAATLGFGAPAHAAVDSTGHYFSSASKLQCTQFVHDDGDGGSLSVQYSAGETRPDVDHFRGAYAVTRLVAQELTYNGTWRNVKYGARHIGAPVVADVANGQATSWFYYKHATTPTPRFTINVLGFDDIFRVQVRTRIYSDENARLAYLKDTLGNCHL